MSLVRRLVVSGIEAANRRDYAAAFVLYDERTQTRFAPGLVELGLEPLYRGVAARTEGERRWRAEWDDLRYLPEELLDLDDGRIVVLGRLQGTGASSGAPFESEWALVIGIAAGRVREEAVFMDRRAALDAAGLA